MRKPRVGFRAFLLITTLGSLVAATIALWARVGNIQSAMDHSNRATRARAEAYYVDINNKLYRNQIVVERDAVRKAKWQAVIDSGPAVKAKYISEAEHHEQLARSYHR